MGSSIARPKPKYPLLAVVGRSLKLRIRVKGKDDGLNISTVVRRKAVLHRSRQQRLPQTGLWRPHGDHPPQRVREPRVSNGKAFLERPCRALSGRELQAHRLRVASRHRLLLQPNGLEGLGAGRVELHTRHLPAPYLPDADVFALDLLGASWRTTVDPRSDKHPLSAIAQLDDLLPVAGPRTEPVAPSIAQSLHPEVGLF